MATNHTQRTAEELTQPMFRITELDLVGRFPGQETVRGGVGPPRCAPPPLQIVEDFDDSYWSTFRDHERQIRDELVGGKRHLLEARQKEQRRTHGRAGHEARPAEGDS